MKNVIMETITKNYNTATLLIPPPSHTLSNNLFLKGKKKEQKHKYNILFQPALQQKDFCLH